MNDNRVEEPFVLEITNEDLDPAVIARLKAQEETVVLSGDAVRALYDAMPRAVAKRIERIVPGNYDLAELTLTFAVKGNLLFGEVGGSVTAKLVPKRDQ